MLPKQHLVYLNGKYEIKDLLIIILEEHKKIIKINQKLKNKLKKNK